MMLLILISVLMILIVAWYLSDKKKPPGPKGLPFVGYLPWLDPKKPYQTLTNLSHKYGPIYGFSLGSLYVVVLSDSKLIRQAFAKAEFNGRAPLYLTHGIMKGYGLICAEGPRWRDQRKFVSMWLKNIGMSKYGTKRQMLENSILDGVKEFISKIDKKIVEGKLNQTDIFDPSRLIMHCVGNVINVLIFGITYDEDDDEWLKLQETQEEGAKMMGVAGILNFLPFLRFLPSMQKTYNYIIEGQQNAHKTYGQIIEKFQQKSIEEQSKSDHLVKAFIDERKIRGDDDFLCDRQFYTLCADMHGAGTETTASTIRWIVLYMAKYPMVQKRLQADLDSVVGNDRLPSLSDIDQLPYLEATVAEVQRIRTVVPVGVPHGSMQDVTLDNYQIPAGAMVIPLLWSLHMDEKLWGDPTVFRPERFLTDDGKFFKPDYFIPFQTGKRMCVGEELGKMIVYLFTSAIFQKYFVSLDETDEVDFDGVCGFTLTPSKFHVSFSMRN